MQQKSKFEWLSALKPTQFKRLTGVRRETFDDVDASESPVERPKKDNGVTTPARRNNTPSKHSLSSTSTASK
jgi:hypothetical protein